MTYDGATGSAGGAAFGAALRTFALERGVSDERMAEACGLAPGQLDALYQGTGRIGIGAMARLVQTLRTRPIEFMQRTGLLSLEIYAYGLDPLYFLPEGPVRYDARIYMREINPRHQVPEGDMTRRNPTIKALADDVLLDAQGKIELELAYLLRTAVQQTGGVL